MFDSIPDPWRGQRATPPLILPVKMYRHRVLVTYESWSGRQRREYLWIDAVLGDSETTLLGRASNAFRAKFGYMDRIVSIVLYPHES